MKRFALIFLTVLLTAVGLPSNSYANNSSKALIWGVSPVLQTFEFGKSGFLHRDLSKKVKWYLWDLENHYYLSLRKPFSIRVAQEIKILDKDSKCTSVPIKVRRHLSLSEAADTSNITSIQFFQSDIGFNKGITPQQVMARPIIFTIGPLDWRANSQEEQDFSIPVCEESIGKPLSGLIGNEITLNYRYSYSTNADESFINIDPKCDEIKDNKCFFNSGIVRIFGIKFSESNASLETLKSLYQETIDREKNYLQSKPCEIPFLYYDQQSNSNILRKDNKVLCNSSLRNLEFLNSEITTLTNAILSAELKAKQEADAKAAAELKAKQEAEAAAEKLIADAKAEAERILAKAAAEKLIADAKAEAERILAAAKAAATAKTTITCTKGKLIKKVTAVKPKCPAGYKVKR